MNIIVSNEIESVCPQFAGAAVEAWVVKGMVTINEPNRAKSKAAGHRCFSTYWKRERNMP